MKTFTTTNNLTLIAWPTCYLTIASVAQPRLILMTLGIASPFFNLDVADDPVMHRQVAESFIATQNGGPQGDSMDEELRRSPQLVKMLLKNFNDEVCKKLVPSHWRVYCVAREPDSSLMWSHYSRNHTGVCLEFKVPGTKFAHAWEVEYQKEYPLFTLVISLTSYEC